MIENRTKVMVFVQNSHIFTVYLPYLCNQDTNKTTVRIWELT